MRNCSNCGHRYKGNMFIDTCYKSGHYCITTRMYIDEVCDVNFGGWTPKPSLYDRFMIFFKGA